jgi:protein-tyrosine kinase
MKPEKGLSDYLNGEAELSDLMITSGIGRLTILPAGTPLRNPVELFSSQKMRDFIIEVKNRYPDRYIIIDTPPLLPFADTRSLASLVDGVLFVIREGVVTPENLQDSMNAIDSKKLIGVVYNEATQASLNGHKHYYGYGYEFGKQEGTSGKKLSA